MKDNTPTLGDEHLLPFEAGALPPESVEDKLVGILDSDPEFSEEGTPEDTDESAPREDAGEPEGESEVSESEAAEEPEEEFEDEEEYEGDEEEPELYTVKVDGEEVEVTFDELLNGYSRTADYTRKTQEVSEERKALEAQAAEIRQAREQYAQKLEVMKQALTVPEPDWDKLQEELPPAEFAAQWANHQRRQKDLEIVEQEQQKVVQEHLSEQQTQLQQVVAQEREKVREAIPNWEEQKEPLAEYAMNTYGYSEENLESVVDHRLFVILDKARKFDELQAGKGKLNEKASKAKTLPPGGRKKVSRRKKKDSARSKRAAEKLARSGSVDDAAAVIMERLAD